MTTLNQQLAEAIFAAMSADPNKANYSGTIGAAMGNERRLICRHDPNPLAPNPAVSGVEFLNFASTGPLTYKSGNIASFGTLSGITTRQAADLSTGKAVAILTGKGYSLIYTLGLPGSGCDFTLASSPTGSPNEGYAFAPGSGMRAPRLLASGTGPKAPTIAPTTLTVNELEDWTDQANPVPIGVSRFSESTRVDDFVFQHPLLASAIGDVAVYQVNNTIKWTAGQISQHFEQGSLLLLANGVNTISGVQLEQQLDTFTPYSAAPRRWSSYPFSDTWNKTTRPDLGGPWVHYEPTPDNPFYPGRKGPNVGAPTNADTYDSTFPRPFKIKKYTEAGYKNGAADRVPGYTHEMKAFNDKPAGPINGPQYSQCLTAQEPFIPHFHCAQMLPYQNTRTKLSPHAGRWLNGVTSYSYSADRGRSGDSGNPVIIQISNAQINALQQWHVMPPYPLKNVYLVANYQGPADVAYLNAYESNPKDPGAFPNRDYYAPYRWTGYKYQPGSYSGHDRQTGFGGQRPADRAVCPLPLMIYASNQNWVRPEGNVPIRELVDEFGLAYFNHGNHWIRDAKTFVSLPNDKIDRGDLVLGSGFYGGGPYAALGQPRGPQDTIDMSCPGNGTDLWRQFLDASGRLPYQGSQRDALHGHTNAGWYTIMLNSPMHAIAAVHDYNAQWLGSLGEAGPLADPCNNGEISNGDTFFMYRTGAWRWFQYTMMWLVGSEHYLSVPQETTEARSQLELENLYDKVYVPLKVTNDQRPYFVALRNLGMPVKYSGSLTSVGGSLAFYYVHVMVLMRQSGFEKAMRARSDKCAKVFDMMIELFDRWIIGYILQTDMRDAYYQIISNKASGVTAADIPANWAAQKAWLDVARPVIPPNFVETPDDKLSNYGTERKFKDFTRTWNGRCDEQEGNPHMYLQYLKAREVFWAEKPHPDLPAAIAKMESYYVAHDDAHAQGLANEWKWLQGTGGVFNAPTVLTT